MSLHDADGSIQQEVLGLVTKYVVSHAVSECGSAAIAAAVKKELDLTKYGLADEEFFLIGYVASVPTFRLLQDAMQNWNHPSAGLSTCSTQTNIPAGSASAQR